MKTCLIINPNAGTPEQGAALDEAIAAHDAAECRKTSAPGEGRAMARKALDEGYDCITAAGGDGTIHEVVNGIMGHERAGDPRVCLGVVPLGTGNDLARTLAIPDDPRDALAIIAADGAKALDVIRVERRGEDPVYGLNVAAGGFSGQVDEALTPELKTSWGPLAYLISAASVVPDLTEYDTRLAFDGEPERAMDVLNVIVANGRMAAGGKRVAPLANPCDGLLDVVIVRFGTMLDFAGVSARLMTGNYLGSPHVLHRKVKRLRVDSTPGMWFNMDGELLTKDPVTFVVEPGALRVITGPQFSAEPRLET